MAKIRGKRTQAVGKLRQSVVNSSEGETVSIEFADKLSGLIIAEIEMDMQSFGELIATNGTVEVDYKVYAGNQNLLGKRAIVEKALIPIELTSYESEERQRQFKEQVMDSNQHLNMSMGGWEVNHWEYNSRNHRRDGYYPVSYIKYVEENEDAQL